MQPTSYDQKIAAYLAGELSTEEHAALERELERDPALKKAYILHRLGEPPPPSPENDARAQLQVLREKHGPLPEPRITWLDRLRYADFSFGKWAVAGGLLLLAAWFLAPRLFGPAAVSGHFKSYFQEAKCAENASGGLTGREIFERASAIYCGGSPSTARFLALEDSCQLAFCMSRYYLAHWQFRQGEYAAAAESFRRCLENYDSEINRYRPTQGSKNALMLNLALSKLGADAPRPEVSALLEQVNTAAKPGSEVQLAAQSLLRELEK